MKLSVIVPVYNEVDTIQTVLANILSVELDKEIIIVDDGSTDGTQEWLQKLDQSEDLRILFQSKNQGKGAALRRALPTVSGEIVVFQDADLEYDPQDYLKLIKPIVNDQADVVYGSRFKGEAPHRMLLFWHYFGNQFLTFLSNVLSNLNLSDMETCYKMFRAELIPKLNLKENRFGIEPEITAKFAKLKVRIYEVGISYFGRTYREGKKIGWKDGLRAVWCILRYNLFG